MTTREIVDVLRREADEQREIADSLGDRYMAERSLASKRSDAYAAAADILSRLADDKLADSIVKPGHAAWFDAIDAYRHRITGGQG